MESREQLKQIRIILSTLPVIKSTTFKGISPDVIINNICESYKINFEKIRTKTKKREIVEPRQVISFFIKKYTKKEKQSYSGNNKNVKITNQDIATILNIKNHTTILHSVKTVENQINTDKSFRAKIALLENNIKEYEQVI